MPLKPYQRGSTWWAKGRIEYNGRAITGYFRESTGALDEAGARDWIRETEDRERRRYIVGDEASALTFAGAVLLYGKASPSMAKYLKPLVVELGEIRCDRITAGMIRALGPKLYPKNCTDSWRRWVITPARAVINNANDLGHCPPIRIKGFSEAERVEQDKRRKKASRIEQRPGDWEWLLKFRQHAPQRHAALALFMFATGARIGQAVAMHPKHLRLQEGKVTVPGAKGHADREITIPPELVAELANLKPKTPRGWDRSDKRNQRVFGFASGCGPLKSWRKACKDAKIEYIPPHAAGRHGFGQEHVVRQGTDDKAAGKYGGWRDTGLMRRTYTHAEDADGKILAGFRTGLVQAEKRTGIKLVKTG